jgi:hypothetical protein
MYNYKEQSQQKNLHTGMYIMKENSILIIILERIEADPQNQPRLLDLK